MEEINPNIFSCNLDPQDWSAFRESAHRILDQMIDHMETVHTRKVWQMMPTERRKYFQSASPEQPDDIDRVFDDFKDNVALYTAGNLHPGFCGWVQGGGNPAGMVGDICASAMNMNCGGRNHSGVVIEQQIIQWTREWFRFPDAAQGLFVSERFDASGLNNNRQWASGYRIVHG